jgi:ABC-2 type transport system ATP-binding protein
VSSTPRGERSAFAVPDAASATGPCSATGSEADPALDVAPDAVVVVDHLHKAYGGTVAVRDVTFEVRRGEIFGLLGSNGAGKTTTVECLEGLRRPDGGAVQVLGVDPLAHPEQLRGRVGCQLQESHLPERMKVWEVLHLFAAAAPRPVDYVRLMDEWGLAEKRTAAFGSLSGGQRQRLLVALALVTGPEVVFLDEMTTGLDPAARRTSWGLIERIRDSGATVVLVTHFMDEADRLCDRVAVMDGGEIVALDTPARLVAASAGEVRVTFTAQGDFAWLAGLPPVRAVNRHGAWVEVLGEGPVLNHVAAALLERGLAPLDLQTERPTLEETFLKLTGHGLD